MSKQKAHTKKQTSFLAAPEAKTIRMKREIAAVSVPAQTPFAPVMPAPAAVSVSEVFHETPQQGVVIESPMVGMYYASPTPGAEPFVKTGSCVKKGDVLCIIEAMKVMNEIHAPRAGVIKEIRAKDGDMVQFDEELMVIGD